MNKSALQDIQQALNVIRGEIERVDDETKWAALELMLSTSSSVVALAKKMAEGKKSERTSALKEVKRLCKEFGFTAGMLKSAQAEGKKKEKPLKTIDETSIKKVIDKITKSDGLQKTDLTKVINQLKLSVVDTGMKLKELEAYLNSKEFSNELKSEKVQNLLSSKEFLGKIQKKFEKLTNK